MIQTFLNPEGHQNCVTGSKVMAILLKVWILPIGGASAVEGLRSTGLPRLVYIGLAILNHSFEIHFAYWSPVLLYVYMVFILDTF